jgi:hypothetical protein
MPVLSMMEKQGHRIELGPMVELVIGPGRRLQKEKLCLRKLVLRHQHVHVIACGLGQSLMVPEHHERNARLVPRLECGLEQRTE